MIVSARKTMMMRDERVSDKVPGCAPMRDPHFKIRGFNARSRSCKIWNQGVGAGPCIGKA